MVDTYNIYHLRRVGLKLFKLEIKCKLTTIGVVAPQFTVILQCTTYSLTSTISANFHFRSLDSITSLMKLGQDTRL